MLQRLLRPALALSLWLVFATLAFAQNPEISGGASTDTTSSSSGPGAGASLAIVFVCTVIILFIICKPARRPR